LARARSRSNYGASLHRLAGRLDSFIPRTAKETTMLLAFDFDPARLVRTIGFALRHNPAHFGLDLDEAGWVSLEDLVIALRFHRYDWALLDEPLFQAVIDGSDRFEIRDSRIRATYGHSIELGKPPPVAAPPPMLFHGTTEDALDAIRREGLKPMRRRFVHLTSDPEYAMQVANAKQSHTVVIVRAATANIAGRVFHCASSRVWLTEWIEPIFLATGLNTLLVDPDASAPPSAGIS
jgi:putative RNA 2'-phosphotransferase